MSKTWIKIVLLHIVILQLFVHVWTLTGGFPVLKKLNGKPEPIKKAPILTHTNSIPQLPSRDDYEDYPDNDYY
ncbi:hypothetical protein Ocin01_10893 [Orchesella cincta]|uniref:Uncharacterized protein n=1 Tax=Orchesella cincta TaxID=48709 RepID=A0A1D2MS81_ORCCI|nr:hypothetical protein Ocin01_10893 [Orchesella cincta]